MKFCQNCGAQNQDENEVCSQCQTPLNELSTAKLKSKSHKKVIIISIAAIFVMAITFIILISTHTICISHEFSKATCIKPKTCEYCGKEDGKPKGHDWQEATCIEPQKCCICNETKGEPLGHDWKNATCTEPKTCKVCESTDGEALGHTKGEWVLTKDATLVDVGVEEISCSVCDESLDSRGTEKKKPKVVGSSFNFNDEEFIDWIEDISTLEVGRKQSLNSDLNTAYLMTNANGDTGVLLLNHGSNGLNGNICGIMIYFDSPTDAMATASWIGEKINFNFIKEDAAIKLCNNKSYTAASMTIMELDVSGMSTTALAPSEFFAELLS